MTTVVPTPLPKIEVASLKAGDILVVTFPEYLSADHFTKTLEGLKAQLPDGVKAMIVEGGATVKVMRADAPVPARDPHRISV